MRPVPLKQEELPETVQAVLFNPPQEGETEGIEPIPGAVHKDKDTGEKIACEFLFELNNEDLATLRAHPYLTLVVLADHLHPFSLQLSFPYTEEAKTLNEHHHNCPSCEKMWRCDDAKHTVEQRKKLCDPCYWDNFGE